MTNILLKTIKLNLEAEKDLKEFYLSSGTSNNQIVVVFSKEVEFFDSTTMKLDKKTLGSLEIDYLTRLEGFDTLEVNEKGYLLYFNHKDIEDIEMLYNSQDPMTGDLKPPHTEQKIEQNQKTIDTVQFQINASREQAEKWEADLNNVKKPALQQMLDENTRFNEKINQAVKKGWV